MTILQDEIVWDSLRNWAGCDYWVILNKHTLSLTHTHTIKNKPVLSIPEWESIASFASPSNEIMLYSMWRIMLYLENPVSLTWWQTATARVVKFCLSCLIFLLRRMDAISAMINWYSQPSCLVQTSHRPAYAAPEPRLASPGWCTCTCSTNQSSNMS